MSEKSLRPAWGTFLRNALLVAVLLLMVGGVFGFLPVLGFWMLPLGLAFIALDIPFTAHRIDSWMVTLKEQAKGGNADDNPP